MKINIKSLQKKGFENSTDTESVEDNECGEFYQYTRDDVLPNIDEYIELMEDSAKQNSVWLGQFEFSQKSKTELLKITSKFEFEDTDAFIKRLMSHARMEQARLSLLRINRDKTNPSHVQNRQLQKFKQSITSSIKKFIELDSDIRSFVASDLRLGLPHIFKGKLENLDSFDVLEFLHLIETAADHHLKENLIDYSRTRTPIFFIKQVVDTWDYFLNGRKPRGSEVALRKLIEILYESMNQPTPDLEHRLNQVRSLNY